jgi:hypothetical protein
MIRFAVRNLTVYRASSMSMTESKRAFQFKETANSLVSIGSYNHAVLFYARRPH